MTKFTKLIPALAVLVALSPLAGNAVHLGGVQKAAYDAGTSIASHLAANSKGRPGEFAAPQVADNSKGRPGEFSAPQYETPLG